MLDSGADASIFPASLVNKGTPVCGSIGKLHDAQGAEIPVQSIQDMEIRLRDLSGRNVLLRERVAISDRVTQPIVCFGHLLESGWGIDGAQQTLVHHSADARVPLELQNKSMVVRGTIRVMSEWIPADNSLHVRAIRADVFDEKLVSGTVGWELDERGCGTGRHFANKYQDPSLVRPDMPGRFCRTTLVQGDDKKWYVLELCERLDGLVQLDTEFHGMHGNRNVVTVITDGDKDPRVMGFALADEQPEQFPVVAEDVEDVEIPADDMPVEGQEIPEGRIVVQPSPEDEVNVNGTILHPTSSLAALRAGCSHYQISTSGSKAKCFQRLLDHAKKLELDMVLATAKTAQSEQERHPLAPVTAEVPSEFEQAQHRLTHVPYKAWCPSCVAHRARVDRHERSGESHASSPPTISFDYFYTKANGEAATADDPDTIIALVVVCSQTSFVKSIPLESKNQMDHMNREVIQFIQMLGHTDVSLRCDNEPSILQLKRLLVKTRQAMGLRTLESSAVAYDHGNSLAENAVGRVRPLAASLMHQLHGRLGIQLSTSSAVWTWALRHAAWILSRFAVVRGATAYELCFGRPFKGELCEFGEPVFGYVVPETKASAKWKRMICLGKADTQSSYILFDGQSILLSRCIRRINTTWRSHMAYYLHCRCFSWQFRTGFGARILPTMKKAVPKQASFALPLEPVELNKLHDKDAEDVFQHAQDEKKAEEERQAMAEHDSLGMDSGQRLETLLEETSADAKETTPFTAVSTSAPMQVEASSASVPSKDVVVIDDPGLAVPVTPPRDDSPGARPRASSAVRPSDGESEEMLKKQKTEESKRQRINQLKAEYEQRLTAVKLAYKEYFTVDDYSTELDAEDVSEDDVWAGEDERDSFCST